MKKSDKLLTIIMISMVLIYITILVKFNIGFSCPFYRNFNIYCPGCGASRMIISLFHGDIYQSFRYNPLLFLLLIIIIIFFIIQIIYYIIKKKLIKISTKIYIMVLITIIAYGVLRNFDIFSFLAPTIVN